MINFVIAIDGPASSGKSTTAKLLAKELGYIYIDTGAMYRACALYAFRHGIQTSDEEAVRSIISKINIEICFSEHGNQILLNQEDVSNEIREESISRMASDISALGCVRDRMVQLQRDMGKNGSVVLDGRDIGTVVFPDADIKFFMTADAETRAHRRWLELKEKGLDPVFDDVLTELKRRDLNDSSRAIAPLRPAEDAIAIDTTRLSISEQVHTMLQMVLQKQGARCQ